MGIEAGFMVPHPPLIVSEVGRGKEEGIRATIGAYTEAARRVAELRPQTLVISSPHAPIYTNFFHISSGAGSYGNFSGFGAPEVSFTVDYDVNLVAKICEAARKAGVPAGTEDEPSGPLDHGVMIPLYFINKFYTDYKIVRMGISALSAEEHYRLGQCVQAAAKALKRSVVFIASGDLSHRLKEDGPYGFAAEGPEYDRLVMEAMQSGDFAALFDFARDFRNAAAECGHSAFLTMAGAFDGTAVKAERLSYEGPFGVGYGVCAFEPAGKDASRRILELYNRRKVEGLTEIRKNEDAYVRLARMTVEAHIAAGPFAARDRREPRFERRDGGLRAVFPDGQALELPPEMESAKAGVFVSIHKNERAGELRGCIGTIAAAKENVAAEIVSNAVSAATRDPRFPAVRAEELSTLVYNVDVLSEPVPIKSLDELDAKRYGVICSKGGKLGLLLPNLEGVDTVQEQLEIACKKGGISLEDKPDIERFEVARHY